MGNYIVVKNTLPSTVEPVVVSTVDQLSHMISNGTLLAGLLTQIPPSGFNQFSSGILSPQAILLAPNSSSLLRKALDAAIVRVLESGGPFQFARDNAPMVVTEANSCMAEADYYPFPSLTEVATEEWFVRGTIRIASLGNVNWDNTGNYQVDPPTGFWPEYYEAISAQLVKAYNSSTTPFNGFTRTYYASSDGVLGSVISGNTEGSEPYFVVDASYQGQGRSQAFVFSCFALASGSTFYTKRSGGSSGPVLSDGAYAGIAIGAVALIVFVCFIIYMIVKERRGEPLFMPLSDREDEDARTPAHDTIQKNYQTEQEIVHFRDSSSLTSV
eukprot:scaffold403_cov183-Ochromonas_danica.AAC.5